MPDSPRTPRGGPDVMSTHRDPVSLERFPKKYAVKLNKTEYNARVLAELIRRGLPWSRLVPGTRVPMTPAEIELIFRLDHGSAPRAPDAPRRGHAPLSAPMSAPMSARETVRRDVRATRGAQYPSRTGIPFHDGRSHPDEAGIFDRTFTGYWHRMDTEYEDHHVSRMNRHAASSPASRRPQAQRVVRGRLFS